MDDAATALAVPRNSLAREFWLQQAPLIGGALVLGLLAAYWQYGFLPGAERAFPVAEVRVPVWHLVWMGVWTGYTMAVVGEAAGIFALPYSMSILQFVNPSVTPSTQLLTFLNPIGALLGFRRSGQWNLKFAAAVCLGGALGGLIGPFLRSGLLAAADVFHFAVGVALAIAGIHLCYAAFHSTARRPPQADPYRNKVSIGARVHGMRIRVSFGDQSWDLNMLALFGVGAGVGMFASALGVGGGFLLVPIFASLYRLPMYVLVAATIPYVIVLSAVGLFTYNVVLPAFGSPPIAPEWAWGFFAAAGGIFGSWAASKTQMYVPEHFLKLMLGGVTGIVGALYVVDFFYPLPFRL
ncbi:MAG TPA: sulfite exporter TauE/SafE family protein [Burkholderiales bacterium]